jgi:hypothetical protein
MLLSFLTLEPRRGNANLSSKAFRLRHGNLFSRTSWDELNEIHPRTRFTYDAQSIADHGRSLKSKRRPQSSQLCHSAGLLSRRPKASELDGNKQKADDKNTSPSSSWLVHVPQQRAELFSGRRKASKFT